MRIHKFVICWLLFLIFYCLDLGLFLPAVSAATNLPAGFVEDTAVTGFDKPTAFDWTPDGRMFVVQKAGLVKVLSPTLTVLNASALQLSVTADSERGLLGITFDPAFSNNGFVYLYYTTGTGAKNYSGAVKNRLSRFKVTGNAIDLATETILLDAIPSDFGNHNGGDLHFDSSGMLYVTAGDGGDSFGKGWSQKLDSMAGKILRVNPVNGDGASGNPFSTSSNVITKRVWAYGLRNPYRISLNPVTGGMVIADVGQNKWEELDIGAAGANYGWPEVEGPEPAGKTGFTYPLFSYGRSNNPNSTFDGCSSVIGGGFKTGTNFPVEYNGSFIFGDYMCKRLWVMKQGAVSLSNPTLFATDVGGPVTIAFGPEGYLYWADIFSGQIRRIKNKTTNPQHCLPLGDINCTGKVDSLDLSYLLAHFGSMDTLANLDDDGTVNSLDLSILLSNLGK
jgi:glucose/arabinose dehydrogenase